MRKVANITEKAVVSKYAEVHGETPTAVVQEISTNMLRTTFPGQLLVVLHVLGQSKWLCRGKERHWHHPRVTWKRLNTETPQHGNIF